MDAPLAAVWLTYTTPSSTPVPVKSPVLVRVTLGALMLYWPVDVPVHTMLDPATAAPEATLHAACATGGTRAAAATPVRHSRRMRAPNAVGAEPPGAVAVARVCSATTMRWPRALLKTTRWICLFMLTSLLD
ncbi:Uncharacterised protein [Xylophilus ampelinus]|nr:Uncharacterised protein [Xylophilus ampelinus]